MSLARGFRPPFVNSLILDLDADLIPGNDGDAIQTWSNQATITGTAFDFTQATSTKRPLIKRNILNGHSGLLADGVDDCMKSTGTFATGPSSVFIVYKMTRTTVSQYIMALRSTAPAEHWFVLETVTTDIQFSAGVITTNAALIKSTTGGMPLDTNPRVLGITYNGSGATTPANYTETSNGTAQTLATGGTDAYTTLAPSALWAFVTSGGTYLNGGYFAGAYIFKVLAYNRQLSAIEALDVGQFLRNRYGL